MNEKYARIISLPHYVSKTRERMTDLERAAQFAPFAALSGFEDEVEEEARITEGRAVLDDGEIERLDLKLRHLCAGRGETMAKITFFLSDARKSGGSYVSKMGYVSEVDRISQKLILSDGTVIAINDIYDIEIT